MPDTIPAALAAEDQASPTIKSFVSIFLVALVVAPSVIVLHEFGHYASQFPLGYQDVPLMSYDSTAMGTAPDDPSGVIDGLTSAAGPVISLLLVLLGVVIARRGGPVSLALTLVVGDWIRVLGALFFNGILAGDSPVDGLSDGFSELAVLPYHLGSMWGAVLVSVIDLVLPFIAAAFVYRALRRRGVRLLGAKFPFALASMIAGYALWLGVLGPVVLP